MLKLSKVFYKNVEALSNPNIRYIINKGGTRSTKTFSLLQILVEISRKYPDKIDIVGQTVHHLKTGILSDMSYICKQYSFTFENFFQKSFKVFKYGLGTINFLSFDKLGKAHGGSRDWLFLNEANHIPYPIVEQLMIRTRKKIFIDYNPTGPFWVDEVLKNEPDKCCIIHSTYKDNPWLESFIIEALEKRKGNNNFWRVYGLGEDGISEGLIFDNFEMKSFDINRFSQYRNGIDWGFSNDPFAFVRCAIEKNKLYICEEIYGKGFLNKEVAPFIKKIIGDERVVCDSAEPKSVAELRSLRVNAHSAKKGPGSIESGIKKLKGFDKIIIHPKCPNVYAEFRNYQWKVDKMGKPVRIPIDAWNHGIDGIRYATEQDLNYTQTILEGDRPF